MKKTYQITTIVEIQLTRKMLSLGRSSKCGNMKYCEHVRLPVIFFYGSSVNLYYFIKIRM